MLGRCYARVVRFADHPHAFWVLGLLAFVQSSFFFLPPDPLLIAMLLQQRQRIWVLPAWCAMASVAGGMVGYAIGACLYESLGKAIIDAHGLAATLEHFRYQLQVYGFWIVAGQGVTPIPYKVVAIVCGVVGMDFLTFILASCVAKMSRYLLLAALVWFYGPACKDFIAKNLHLAVFVVIGGIVAGCGVLRLI